jgi:hypothetical protein
VASLAALFVHDVISQIEFRFSGKHVFCLPIQNREEEEKKTMNAFPRQKPFPYNKLEKCRGSARIFLSFRSLIRRILAASFIVVCMYVISDKKNDVLVNWKKKRSNKLHFQ